MANTTPKYIAKPSFSDTEYSGIVDLLKYADKSVDANKSANDLMDYTKGDAKQALSLIKDQYGLDFDVESSYAELTGKKKVPSGLLEMPSQKVVKEPQIPLKDVPSGVETSLTDVLGSEELAKEAMKLGTVAEQKRKEKADMLKTVSTLRNTVEAQITSLQDQINEKVAAYEKANPMDFPIAAGVPMHATVTRPRYKGYDQDAKQMLNLRSTASLLDDAENFVTSEDKKTAFGRLISGFKKNKDLITFGFNSLINNMNLADVAVKADKQGIGSLTESEKNMLVAYGTLQNAQSMNESFAYSLGDGVAQSVPFMLQMLMAGGTTASIEASAAAITKKMADRGLVKKMMSTAVGRFAGKSAAAVAKAAVKGAAIAAVSPQLPTAIAKERIGQVYVSPEGELESVQTQGIGTAIAKGAAKTVAEFGTEFLGSSIGLGLSNIASKSKFLSKTLALTKIDSPALQRAASAIGFSNFGGEVSGELLNNGINAVIDGEDPIAAMTNLNSLAQITAQSLLVSGTMKTMDVGFKVVGKTLGKLSSTSIAPEHSDAINKIVEESEDSDSATQRITEYAMNNSESKSEAKDIIVHGIGKVATKGVKEGNQATADTVAEELQSSIEQHQSNPSLETANDVIDATKDALKVKQVNLNVNEDIRAINDIIDNLNENEIIEFINNTDYAIADGDVESVNEGINKISEAVNKTQIKPEEAVKTEEGQIEPAEIKEAKYGDKNTLFTKDKYEASKKNIVDPKLTSGFDFNKIEDLVNIAGYHIEAGARDFVDFSKRMVDEFGDAIKPHLENIWKKSGENFEGLAEPTKEQINEVTTYEPKPITYENKQENQGTAEAGAEAGVKKPAEEAKPEVKQEKVEGYAAKEGELEEGNIPERGGIGENLREEGGNRNVTPIEQEGGGEAGGGNRVFKGREVTKEEVKAKQKAALAAEIGAEQKQTIKELEAGQLKAEKTISKLNEELNKVKSQTKSVGLQQSKVEASKAVSSFFKEGKGVLPHSIYKAALKKIVQATPSNINKVLEDISSMTENVEKLQQVGRIGKQIGNLDPRMGGNLASSFMKLKKLGVKGKFTYSLFKNPKQAAKVFVDGISHNITEMPENLLNDLEVVLTDLNKKVPDVTKLPKFLEDYGDFLNESANKNLVQPDNSIASVTSRVDKLTDAYGKTDMSTRKGAEKIARSISSVNAGISNLLSSGSIEVDDNGLYRVAKKENGEQVDTSITQQDIDKINDAIKLSEKLRPQVESSLKEITSELESNVRQHYKAFNPTQFKESFGSETLNMVQSILLWMNDSTFKNTNIPIQEWENLSETLNQINNNGFVPTALGSLYKLFNYNHKVTTQKVNVVNAIDAIIEENPKWNDIGKGLFRYVGSGIIGKPSAYFGSILSKSAAYVDDALALTNRAAKKIFPFYENMTSSSNEAAQKMQSKIDAMSAPIVKAVADLQMELMGGASKAKAFIVGMPNQTSPKVTKSLNKVGILMAALRSYDLSEGQFEDKTSKELLDIADHFGGVLRRTGESTPELQKEKFIKDNNYRYSSNSVENKLIKTQIVEAYEEIQTAMANNNMDAIRSREDIIKLLTPAESKFYESITDAYSNSQNDSFAAMLLNGEVYEMENNYMPFQNAEKSAKEEKEQDILDSFLNRVVVGKSSATKYKDPNIVKAINYNPYGVFLRYANEMSRNLYLQPEYYARKKALQRLFNENKASKTAANVELKNLIDKFLETCNIDMDYGFKSILQSRGKWWNSKIGVVYNGKFRNINPLTLAGRIMGNMGVYHLATIPRIVAEPVTQGIRISPETGISALVSKVDAAWTSFADLNMETALTDESINKSITTPEIRTVSGEFKKQKLPFTERIRLQGGVIKSTASAQAALANRMTSKKLWTKAFLDAYSEFTGEQFDVDKYLNDEEYRFKADTDPLFVRSKRYANRTVEAKTVALTRIAAPKSIVGWGGKGATEWFGTNGPAAMLTLFGKYTKNMADETDMSFKRAYRFKDPKELNAAAANVSSNIAYGIINSSMIAGMIMAGALILDRDDMFEEQQEKLKKIFKNFGSYSFVQACGTLLAGGYNIAKMTAAATWYAINKQYESNFMKGGMVSDVAIKKHQRDAQKFYSMWGLDQLFPNWYGEKERFNFVQKAAETALGNYMMAANGVGDTFNGINAAISELEKPASEQQLSANFLNATSMAIGVFLGVPNSKDIGRISRAYIGNKWSSDPDFKRANADLQYASNIGPEAVKLIEQGKERGFERHKGIETIYKEYGFIAGQKGGMSHADNIEFLSRYDNVTRINLLKGVFVEASQKKNKDKYSEEAINSLRYEGFIVGCLLGSIKEEMVVQNVTTKEEFIKTFDNVLKHASEDEINQAWQYVNMSAKDKKDILYTPGDKFFNYYPEYWIRLEEKLGERKLLKVDIGYQEGV